MSLEREGRRVETSKPEVASLGDVIVDEVIPLNAVNETADYVPREGESIVVEDAPEYLRELSVEQEPGGRGPHQALAASLAGADTAFYTETGSLEPLQKLEEAGVGIEARYRDRPLSTSYVFKGEGENRIAFSRGPDKVFSDDYLEEVVEKAAGSDCLLLTNGEPEEVVERILEGVKGSGTEVIFDPVPVQGAQKYVEHEAVDYLTPNRVEYDALELDGVDATVIRTAAEGAYFEDTFIPSPEVEVEDTTGAGDTFNGYLAARLSQGEELEEAVEYAVTAASLSVKEQGVQSAMPSLDEVEAALEGR
ncbi:MAG: PfkB family carbohydrate kinase [Candidatus Nanohaloarchaea archaeon]